MKKVRKHLLLCIVLVLVAACVLYLPYLINKVPFEVYTIDTREQNFAFYSEYQRIIQQFMKTGQLQFYSWSNFLGSNFLVSKAFYTVTDIFTVISCVLNLNFWDSVIIMQIVKCVIAATGMFWLLTKFKLKPTTVILGSLCYVFCSSMSYFTVYPHFTTFFAFIPFYLVAVEFFFENKKCFFFSLMTTVMAITNYYYFFILAFFTALYVLYRYFSLNGFYQTKTYFVSLGKLVGKMIIYFTIGSLIAAFVLLPVALFIIQSSRVGSSDSGLLFTDYKVYFQVLVSLLIPLHSFRGIVYPFESANYAFQENFMWAGSFLTLMLAQTFFDKNKQRKMVNFFAFTIMTLILFIPFLNSMVHGFSEPSYRVTIFFDILLIIIACQNFDEMKTLTKKERNITILIWSLVVFGSLTISSMLEGKSIFNYTDALIIMVCCLCFLLATQYLLAHRDKYKHSTLLLVLFVLFELVTMWKLTLNRYYVRDDRHSYEFMKNSTHIMQYSEGSLNQFLNNLEEENKAQYYRVYFDENSMFWGMGKNSALFYNTNSTSTYDSLFSPSLQKLIKLAPNTIVGSDHYLAIQDPELLNLVNVKYAVVSSEEQLPKNMSWQLVTNSYFDWISIYENTEYTSLGRLISQVKPYSDISNLNDLNEYIVCEEQDVDDIKSSITLQQASLKEIVYHDNYLFGSVSSPQGGFMLITLPYDEGWTVKVNGIETKKYSVNGGFIGVSIPEGETTIEMYYKICGLKEGLMISSIACLVLLSVELVRIRRTRKEISNGKK